MKPFAIERLLEGIAAEYPSGLAEVQREDVKRIAFHIALVLSKKGRDINICDLGGGLGLFSLGCADLGMKVTLVDDFGDSVNSVSWSAAVLDRLHKGRGIKIVQEDVLAGKLNFPPDSLDAVTSFDSIEHWHNSPKTVFHSLLKALRPGGLFLLSGPNCVNIRKRLAFFLGLGEWSRMDDWYEAPVFRGHVREPNVSDLRYIARDLGLKSVGLLGRNFLGYASKNRAIRYGTPILDRALQAFPSLCGNIYLLGYK